MQYLNEEFAGLAPVLKPNRAQASGSPAIRSAHTPRQLKTSGPAGRCAAPTALVPRMLEN
jgi:hypothetical protein